MKKIHDSFRKAEKLISENKKFEAINEVKEFQNRYTMERINKII
jgi:hypothetical protein